MTTAHEEPWLMRARERGAIPPHCYRVVVWGDGAWTVRDMISLAGAQRVAEESSLEVSAVDPIACIFDEAFQLVDRVPAATEHCGWLKEVLARLRVVPLIDEVTTGEVFGVPLRRVGRRERPTAWIAGLREGAAIAISLRRINGAMVIESGRCEPITMRDDDVDRIVGRPTRTDHETELIDGSSARTLLTSSYDLPSGFLELCFRIDHRGLLRFVSLKLHAR
jgi:hypothetical protein